MRTLERKAMRTPDLVIVALYLAPEKIAIGFFSRLTTYHIQKNSCRCMGDWNVLQQHLLPLLANHGDDPEILYECMVVLYLMTQLPPPPKIHLDDEKDTIATKRRTYGSAVIPSFENLVEIKLQFAHSDRALAVLMHWLVEPLQHVGTERSEPENILLDLALNLIHNLLQRRPPVEHDLGLRPELRKRLLAAQDELLLKFAEENVLEMLVSQLLDSTT